MPATSRGCGEEGPTTGAERVLGVLRQRNGQEVRCAVYQETGRPPVFTVWLFNPRQAGGFFPDTRRGFRFELPELEVLAQAIAEARESVATRPSAAPP